MTTEAKSRDITPASCADVTTAQSDTPEICLMISTRTCSVRPQKPSVGVA